MKNAKIINKQYLNDHVIELKIETERLESLPGQWLFIHFLESDTELKRAYSIAEVENKEEVSIFTFLIKLVEGGQASELLKTADKNTKIGIEGPNGHFTLKNNQNPKVFLSTGSGLAPCYRMAKADTSGAKKRFFFSVSYEKDLFYYEKIKALNIPETHISISREETEKFEYGRINIENIDFSKETEFYICGVPAMVKGFMQKLRERGYKNIYVEAY